MSDQIKYYHKNTNFFSKLGGRIVEIMHSLNLVSTDIKKKSFKNSVNILYIPEKIKGLLNEKQKIYSIPARLPMIVPPKVYGFNQLGGYLMNDE